jgi:uncharacterized membrane protein YhaH (DUF805 family)
MSLVDSVRSVLSHYATFSGRARRSEYWWFVLVGGAVVGIFYALAVGTGSTLYAVLLAVVALALAVPTWAVTVRRLHDTDKSGWFLFLGFIPFAGDFIMIGLCAVAGTDGPNRFGPSPKAAPVGAVPAYQA